ncbi:MAG: phosphatase PAP2 family protein [Ardenticatenaceae bacterium]|nr:phosphatase PAP2 family protein [Ardenticatenaceae bacterium]
MKKMNRKGREERKEKNEMNFASFAPFAVKPPPLPLPPEWLARDVAWSGRLAVWGRPRARHGLAWLLARSGDSIFWIAVIAVLLLRGQTLGWDLLWTVLATAVSVFIAKSIFKRERPSGPGRALSADKYSFPSGHAARVTAVAMTLSFAYPLWAVVWLVWATAVSLARVVLARHFLSDIIGGAIVGLVVSLLLQLFL